MFFALVLEISKSFPVTIFIIIGIRTLKLLLYRKHRVRDWRTDVLTWCSFTLSLYLYRTADWSGIVSWNTRVKLLSMAVVLLLRWISPVRVAFKGGRKILNSAAHWIVMLRLQMSLKFQEEASISSPKHPITHIRPPPCQFDVSYILDIFNDKVISFLF